MDILFVLKILVLFVVGGGSLTFLSFLAEKSSSKVSGIILSFPSTIVISFFFLAWTISPQAVSLAIPSTLAPLGLGIFFPIVYIYCANYLSKFSFSKQVEVFGSFIISTLFWLVLSIPFAVLKFSNLFMGILVYFLLLVISHYILHRKIHNELIPIKYSTSEKIFRTAFIGLVLVFAVLLGKAINPFWGGILTMFPAGLSSILAILHWQYSPRELFPLVKRIPVGSLLIFSYALSAMYFFPTFGFIFGTIISYDVSLIVYFGIKKFL